MATDTITATYLNHSGCDGSTRGLRQATQTGAAERMGTHHCDTPVVMFISAASPSPQLQLVRCYDYDLTAIRRRTTVKRPSNRSRNLLQSPPQSPVQRSLGRFVSGGSRGRRRHRGITAFHTASPVVCQRYSNNPRGRLGWGQFCPQVKYRRIAQKLTEMSKSILSYEAMQRI